MTAAAKPVVFGAPYSVYVRAVRLALEAKLSIYELVPSIFSHPVAYHPSIRCVTPSGKFPPSSTPASAYTRRAQLRAM